jgi:hypothetical protein
MMTDDDRWWCRGLHACADMYYACVVALGCCFAARVVASGSSTRCAVAVRVRLQPTTAGPTAPLQHGPEAMVPTPAIDNNTPCTTILWMRATRHQSVLFSVPFSILFSGDSSVRWPYPCALEPADESANSSQQQQQQQQSVVAQKTCSIQTGGSGSNISAAISRSAKSVPSTLPNTPRAAMAAWRRAQPWPRPRGGGGSRTCIAITGGRMRARSGALSEPKSAITSSRLGTASPHAATARSSPPPPLPSTVDPAPPPSSPPPPPPPPPWARRAPTLCCCCCCCHRRSGVA